MALTVTNTNTLQLLNILNKNSLAQSTTLKQLTTGKRITSGADDPAGLIALSALNAELRAVDTSLVNNQRTDSMLTVADQAIGEVANLLEEIETLVMASSSDANLTASEIAANQSQVDDALSAIDRIVQTTNFNGKKLLDGSFAIQTTGTDADFVQGLRVFSRSQSTTDTVLTVTRVASAQKAEVAFQIGQATNAQLTTSGTTEVAVGGALGTATITLVDGLTLTQIRDEINKASDQTGVTAVLSTTVHDAGTSAINLQSTTYGTSAFVSVEVLSGGAMNKASGTADNGEGTADDLKSVAKTSGVDANITINGQTAGADGLDVSYSANGLSLEFTLSTAFGSGSQATTTSAFTVKAAGGATFQLGTTKSTRATIGIDSLSTYNLGGGNGSARLSQLKSGGTVDLRTDVGSALTTVQEAISELAGVRGRIGGFQKFQVGASLASLQAAQLGLSSAASVIGDTDFAVATATLTQQNVLIQSGITLLGIANQQSAQLLSLL
ncbi:MAG: flagellin [Phycisphaerae bacterium]